MSVGHVGEEDTADNRWASDWWLQTLNDVIPGRKLATRRPKYHTILQYETP